MINTRLKYDYSVISVIVDSLPGNTKNRESTRSWLIGVRLFYPWAVCLPSPVRDMSHSYMCNTLHEWGKSHMPHIYMYEWVMSHIRMSFTHVITSHMPHMYMYEWNEATHVYVWNNVVDLPVWVSMLVYLPLWVSHITRTNESYEWVISESTVDLPRSCGGLSFMSDDTHRGKAMAWHTYEWVMWASPRTNESCERVLLHARMSHVIWMKDLPLWVSHVTRTNEACEWDRSYARMRHVSRTNQASDMAHSYA